MVRACSCRPLQLARKCSHRPLPVSERKLFIPFVKKKHIVWLKPKFQRIKPLAHWFQNCVNFCDSFFNYKDIQFLWFWIFLTVHLYFLKENYFYKNNCFFNLKFRTVLIFLLPLTILKRQIKWWLFFYSAQAFLSFLKYFFEPKNV